MRPKVSFANVMSVIAVFVALGGAAYAGTKINGKTIKNNSIPAKKLKKSVLKGLDKCPSNAPEQGRGASATATSSARRLGHAALDVRRATDCGCRPSAKALLVTNAGERADRGPTRSTDTDGPSDRVGLRPYGRRRRQRGSATR